MYAIKIEENGEVQYAAEGASEDYIPGDMIQVAGLPEGDITDYDYAPNDGFVLNTARKAAREAAAEKMALPSQTDINTANIDYLAMMMEVEL